MVHRKDSPVGDMEEVKTKARERDAREREARRFYNRVFREVPFWLKAVYRGPLVLIAVLIAILVTFVIPLLAGVAALLVATAIADGGGGVLYWLGVWILGLVLVSSIGIGGIALYSIWSATLDAIKRTFGLLRGE